MHKHRDTCEPRNDDDGDDAMLCFNRKIVVGEVFRPLSSACVDVAENLEN